TEMPLEFVAASSRVTRLRLAMDTQTASSETAIQSGSPPTANVASGRNSSIERFSAEGEPGGEDCAMPAGASSKHQANDKGRNRGRGAGKGRPRSAFIGMQAAANIEKRISSSLRPAGHDSTRAKLGNGVPMDHRDLSMAVNSSGAMSNTWSTFVKRSRWRTLGEGLTSVR